MVDEQLSRAVVAYLLGGRYVRPSESPDAVAGAVGAEAAEHLVPRLRELAREAVCWPVDWQGNDDVSAMRVVEREIAGAHPELSAEAVRALSLAGTSPSATGDQCCPGEVKTAAQPQETPGIGPGSSVRPARAS